MATMALILGQDQCHTGIYEFYKTIADVMKCDITEDTRFDCSKILVTKGIQDEIFSYYQDKGSSEAEIGALWAQLGPKANIKAGSSGGLVFNYVAIVDEDFITYGEEEEETYTYAGAKRRRY